MQEKQERLVWSLGREGPLEEGMAAHSSIPAWSTPWTGELGWLQFIGSQWVRHDWSDFAQACIPTFGAAFSLHIYHVFCFSFLLFFPLELFALTILKSKKKVQK